MKKAPWGEHLILNLHDCSHHLLTDKNFIRKFLEDLTKLIKMKPYGDPQVARFGNEYLEGVSGYQMIETSNISIHCDEVGNKAFVDVFSCAPFDEDIVESFCVKQFLGKSNGKLVIPRN